MRITDIFCICKLCHLFPILHDSLQLFPQLLELLLLPHAVLDDNPHVIRIPDHRTRDDLHVDAPRVHSHILRRRS